MVDYNKLLHALEKAERAQTGPDARMILEEILAIDPRLPRGDEIRKYLTGGPNMDDSLLNLCRVLGEQMKPLAEKFSRG